MHIVKKNISGHDYYYLNKSVREGSKVKSVNVAYLGKDKKEAEKKAEEIINSMKNGKQVSDKENNDKKKQEKQQIKEIKPIQLNIGDMAILCKRKGFVYASGELYVGLKMQMPELINTYKPDIVILLVGSANRFNLVDYDLYNRGSIKNFICNLRIYKMARILHVNLKGKMLERKARYGFKPRGQKSNFAATRI